MSADIPSWYRKRGYLHFDLPISVEKAKKIVLNKNGIARHAFYPFIHYEISAVKIKRDPSTRSLIKSSKDRPISYSAHSDSHIYAYYSETLGNRYEEKILESGVSENVLAFRSLGKSNIDFVEAAFSSIRSYGNCTAIGYDITGFFDHLDHCELKSQWSKILGESVLPDDHYAVFKSITKYSKVSREALYEVFNISKSNPKGGRTRICEPTFFRSLVRDAGLIEINKKGVGIPQGSPISALLSNVYMFEFDIAVSDFIKNIGGKYFRYCDDMLFIVPPGKDAEVEKMVTGRLTALKLSINPNKTEIRNFSIRSGKLLSPKPLQYLGFTFDGQKILIRSSALSRYSEKMKRGVRVSKARMRKVNMSRMSRGEPEKALYKKKIYERYAHTGKRNFLRYGYRAADQLKSDAIRKQLKPLWRRLHEQIEK